MSDESNDVHMGDAIATNEDILEDVSVAPGAGGGDEDEGLTEEDRMRIEAEEKELKEEAEREAMEEMERIEFENNSDACYDEHAGPVYKVALHPTHHGLIATGGGDDVARVWHAAGVSSAGPGTVAVLGGHEDSVVDLAFNHDGSLLATACLDGLVRVFSAANGWGLVCDLDGPTEGAEWMRWHPRGNVILAGSTDATVWMWSVSAQAGSGVVLQVFNGHSAPVADGCFWNDGRSVCTVSEDGALKVWNPKTSECTLTVAGHGFHEGGLVCVDVHPRNAVAATGAHDKCAKLAHLETGKVLLTLNHPEYVETVAFCGIDQPFLATGCGDGCVRVWDTTTGMLRNEFRHEDGFAVVRCEWGLNSPLLYSSSTDGTTRVWDYRTGKNDPVVILQGHTDGVLDFQVARDGSYVVSGADDNRALVFSTILNK